MAAETQRPDALAAQANQTGVVTSIDEDPDSDGGDWLAWDGNGNTSCRVTFPTPTGSPTTGAGLQEFRVLLRNDAAGTNGTGWSLQLFENAVLDSTIATGTDPNEAGEVIAGTWDASSLGTADGSIVECMLLQTSGGTGNPSARKGIEVGAIEWNVTYTVGAALTIPIAVHHYRQMSNA